jgi:hypothetical protein
VDKSTRKMLNRTEQELLRAVRPGRLRKLDEDELAALHGRVRRARDKYAKLYRRRASAQVKANRGRAMASKAHQRTAAKAEAFEAALAQVSRRLAKVAAARAGQLRDERLAAARAGKGPKGRSKPRPKATTGSRSSGHRKGHRHRRTPERKRAAASARAATRRHQAKRAGR